MLLWIAVFLLFFQGWLINSGKEHRYMLPAYAAFAVLGAHIANQIRIVIDKKMTGLGTSLFLVALLLAAFWSAPMGLSAIYYNQFMLVIPF